MVTDVIIMAGGSGTRLWPASARHLPKQYLAVDGEQSFFDLALKRAHSVLDSAADETQTPEGRLIIIAAASHLPLVKACVSRGTESEKARTLLVNEPVARNTAPAMACAVALIQKALGADRSALVLTSDHLIEPIGDFLADVGRADALAREGWLCVFGIPPTHPATGFGYIEQGQAIANHPGCYQVEGFREKPDEATARAFLDKGGFSWNSGMFCFATDRLAAAFDEYAPAILAPFMGLPDPVIATNDIGSLEVASWPGLEGAYHSAPATSFDYAIAEKARHRALVPASFAWRDIGSWDDWAAMHEAKRAAGDKESLDVGKAQGIAVESRNCFVDSDIPVALCEVDDLIVVIRKGENGEEPRALVCRRGASQRVKDVVEALKGAGREELL